MNEPSYHLLSPNEEAWLWFIRRLSNDTDPGITLGRVQKLRRLFRDTWPQDIHTDVST